MKKVVALLVILLAYLSGCSGSNDKAAAGQNSLNQSSAEQNSPILLYSIVTGSGGGFTGMYQGYEIDSAGYVKSWEGITYDKSKKQEAGRLTSQQTEELNKLIDSTQILKTDYSTRGNITSFIRFTSPAAEEHRVSWEGPEPGGSTPQNIRIFNDRLSKILKTLTVKK